MTGEEQDKKKPLTFLRLTLSLSLIVGCVCLFVCFVGAGARGESYMSTQIFRSESVKGEPSCRSIYILVSGGAAQSGARADLIDGLSSRVRVRRSGKGARWPGSGGATRRQQMEACDLHGDVVLVVRRILAGFGARRTRDTCGGTGKKSGALSPGSWHIRLQALRFFFFSYCGFGVCMRSDTGVIGLDRTDSRSNHKPYFGVRSKQNQ